MMHRINESNENFNRHLENSIVDFVELEQILSDIESKAIGNGLSQSFMHIFIGQWRKALRHSYAERYEKQEGEFFAKKFLFPTFSIQLDFYIAPLERLSLKYSQQVLPITSIIDFSGPFDYRATECPPNYCPPQKPIIVVPWHPGNKEYLIVDGNKRLAYSISHNIVNINAIYLSNSFNVANCIAQPFSRAVYLMLEELLFVSELTPGEEDSHWLIRSYAHYFF